MFPASEPATTDGATRPALGRPWYTTSMGSGRTFVMSAGAGLGLLTICAVADCLGGGGAALTLGAIATKGLGIGVGGAAGNAVWDALKAGASKVDERVADSTKRLANHDLQALAGRAIAVVIVAATKDCPGGPAGRAYLERAAKRFPDAWSTATLDSRYNEVLDKEIPKFFGKADGTRLKTTSLTIQLWQDLVGSLADVEVGPDEQLALTHAARRLHEQFPKALFELAKEDFAPAATNSPHDGKAFAALLLTLTRNTMQGISDVLAKQDAALANDKKILDELEVLRKLLPARAHHIAQLSPDALAASEQRVIAEIDALAASLADAIGRLFESLTALHEEQQRQGREQTRQGKTLDGVAASLNTLLAHHALTWHTVTLRPFSHTVPTHYVPRQALLTELAAKLAAAQQVGVRQTIAAHGDGGEGKTVLAIAYANAALHGELGPDHQYPGGVVFASVGDRTLQAALASALADLPGDAKMDERQKAQLVHGKLSRPPRSLLIIDNVDDGALWTSEAIQAWLPSDNCRVIATTRAESLGPLPMQRVGEVDLPTAVALLAKFRPDAADPANHAAIATIHKEVAGLALALAAVGAYMQIDAESAAPGEAKSWADEAAFLKEAPLDQFHDRADGVRERAQHKTKTVAAIEALRQRLTPAELLALDFAACLPKDMVPTGWLEDLVAECAKHKPPRNWLSRLWTKFLAARLRQPARLLATPLGTSSNGDPHTPGSLVQRLIKLDLLRLERDELASFPETTDVARRRAKIRSLHRLHAKQCTARTAAAPGRAEALLTTIAAYTAARWTDIVVGNDGNGGGTIDNPTALTDPTLRWELSPLAAMCAALWTSNLPGPAARVGVWLAVVLKQLGRYAEAAACLQLEPETDDSVATTLGHSHFAACYSNLATIQRTQGNLPAARRSIERSIEIESKHLGSEHSNLATAYSNLALIQHTQSALCATDGEPAEAQRELAAARASIERAIVINTKHYTADHPAIAINLSVLATIRKAQGDLYETDGQLDKAQNEFAAARSITERAIEIGFKHFEKDHPALAVRYTNLAVIQTAQGELYTRAGEHIKAQPEFAAARTNTERAIEIYIRHFDRDHPNLATNYSNLAHLCVVEGNIPEAVAQWRKAYTISLQALGPDHAFTEDVAAALRKYSPPGP
jgi:tetratricopeptide (TPR) repeat protein